MVFEKIVEVIVDKMGISPDEISMDTSFESMKVDSLDLVEIVMDLEEAFGVTIEESDDLKNVGDLVRYIEKNM